MKIDLSTVILVILCVIPGLFAQRSRNTVCPQSLDDQGASAELGELVALGISTHGLLICIAGSILVIAGMVLNGTPLFILRKIDAWPAAQWTNSHAAESLIAATVYVFLSFAASHWMGLGYGIWRQQRSPITRSIFKKMTWLKRWGVPELLGDRPIMYEALSPAIDVAGVSFLVFVELQMKGDGGFYLGQVKQFAIVGDEAPHKPIVLIKPYFKKLLGDPYSEADADSLMLDLADVSVLFIKQLPPSS